MLTSDYDSRCVSRNAVVIMIRLLLRRACSDPRSGPDVTLVDREIHRAGSLRRRTRMLGIIPMADIVPMPGLPGFVTVTGIVPAVAMADAGIVAINWFGVKKVVVCCTPLKFTVAPDAKLLPLIVSVIPGPPACALSGESSMMDGTTPGCDMTVLGGIDPHPTHRIMRRSKEINFMAYSS